MAAPDLKPLDTTNADVKQIEPQGEQSVAESLKKTSKEGKDAKCKVADKKIGKTKSFTYDNTAINKENDDEKENQMNSINWASKPTPSTELRAQRKAHNTVDISHLKKQRSVLKRVSAFTTNRKVRMMVNGIEVTSLKFMIAFTHQYTILTVVTPGIISRYAYRLKAN